MKRILLLLILIIPFQFAGAQSEQSVTGTVIDENGETLPGVNILIKGTSTGTVTDFDGNFAFNVSSEAILQFSYIGYVTEEVLVGTQSTLDIQMILDATSLSEVVVIGYGTQKKKVVTGAIASVSAEQITATPILRIEQALQGRTPGVQVTNLSGQPGEAPTVRIRGAGTTGDATPLYIVDGLPVNGIDYLNPGDIESMDVLKDAASAAIYGARAANGVVLITTKTGTKGKMNVSYSGYVGIQNVARRVEMMNAEEYRMMMNEGARNGGFTEPFDLNEIPKYDTDWQEELFQKNAPISSHQISVSGGGDKSTFASSISKFSQQGIIGGDKSQFDRYTGRLNSNHKVNKMFSFGNNLAYTHIITRGIASNASFNGPYSSAINLDPLTPVYQTDSDLLNQSPYSGNPVVTDGSGQVYGISNYVGAEVVNPLALLETVNGGTKVDRLVGNIFGELEPIEGLKLKTSYGMDMAYVNLGGYRSLYFLNNAQYNTDKTSVNKTIERYFSWQWENTITYNKRINDHNFGALAGVTAKEDRFDNLGGFNAKVPVSDPDNVYLDQATDTVWTAFGGAREAALYSLFGRVTYDYKDKYSFTGIIRRDGSSKFGANKRFGYFPSIGVAWIASDEAFLQNLGPVNLLKFRGSWGVNGNQNIGDYRFVSTIDRQRGYIFGGGRSIGSSPSYVENQDIQWEESRQLDIAADLGLFENRLTITVDYYKKTTEKLLETIPIPGHVGNDPPVVNAGSVENKGIEMSINWREVKGDFEYSIGLNGGYNKNKMTKISNAEKVIQGASWAIAGPVTRSEEGLPIAYFWGYETAGIFQNQTEVYQHINSTGNPLQPNAEAGDVRFVDVNGDGIIDEKDRTMIGNPTPDFTFGLTGNIDYKSFNFSFLFTGVAGNDVFNGMSRRDLRFTNRPTTLLDRWNGEGTSDTQPRYTWDDSKNYNNRISDLYIENGSYMRLKNVQLGYNISSSILEKMGATKWHFYISAENLFTITKYSGADPEIGAMSAFDIGIDRAIYPQARTFRLGTTLTF